MTSNYGEIWEAGGNGMEEKKRKKNKEERGERGKGKEREGRKREKKEERKKKERKRERENKMGEEMKGEWEEKATEKCHKSLPQLRVQRRELNCQENVALKRINNYNQNLNFVRRKHTSSPPGPSTFKRN